MTKTITMALGLAAMVPTTAAAECVPSFASAPTVVEIRPDATFGSGQLIERFSVRLRNDGDSICQLRLTVGRDVAGSAGWFPEYVLTGPGGEIASLTPGTSPGGEATSPVVIPAGREVSVPYQVRTKVGWGDHSGDYSTSLLFALSGRDSSSEVANQRTELHLEIPATAAIRFAGAGAGGGGSARLELGELTPNVVNRSPPFAVRVLSTSAYQMQVTSENSGALVRTGGVERLPYRMTIGGHLMSSAGGGSLTRGTHSSATGDLFPVAVTVIPDAEQRAGDYNDRVTVSVTPI